MGPFYLLTWFIGPYWMTGYKLSPIKLSNTGKGKNIDVLMYFNTICYLAALGIQGIFLPTPYGSTRTEWVKMRSYQVQGK